MGLECSFFPSFLNGILGAPASQPSTLRILSAPFLTCLQYLKGFECSFFPSFFLRILSAPFSQSSILRALGAPFVPSPILRVLGVSFPVFSFLRISGAPFPPSSTMAPVKRGGRIKLIFCKELLKLVSSSVHQLNHVGQRTSTHETLMVHRRQPWPRSYIHQRIAQDLCCLSPPTGAFIKFVVVM